MHPLDVALPWQLGALVNIHSWFRTDHIGGFRPLETRIDPGLNPFEIRVRTRRTSLSAPNEHDTKALRRRLRRSARATCVLGSMAPRGKDRWSLIAQQASERAREKAEAARARRRQVWKERWKLLRRPELWPEAARNAWKEAANKDAHIGKEPLGHVAVVGAGVRGLAVAHRLARTGCRVTVFDAGEAGGATRTVRERGFRMEKGAREMEATSSTVAKVLEELGLDGRRTSLSKLKMGVLQARKVYPVPSNPLELIASRLLETWEKREMMLEPFVWKKSQHKVRRKRPKTTTRPSAGRSKHSVYQEENEETLGQFFKRHFQTDAVLKVVEPFYSGYVGYNPNVAPARFHGTRAWDIEQKYGSLVIGALSLHLGLEKVAQLLGSAEPGTGQTIRVPKPGKVWWSNTSASPIGNTEPLPLVSETLLTPQGEYKLDTTDMVHDLLLRKPHVEHIEKSAPFTFPGGMQELTDAFVASVGEKNIKQKCPVVALDRTELGEFHRPVWQVSCSTGGWKRSSESFDAIVIATPLSCITDGTLELFDHNKKVPVNWMPRIEYAPVSVISVGVKREGLPELPPVRSIKVPASEDYMNCFEISFPSNVSKDSAPDKYMLVTGYVGGPDNPKLAKREDPTLPQKLLKDVKNVLGANAAPVFVRSFFWQNAVPLFPEGYSNTQRSLKKMEDLLPGLYFAGDYLHEQDIGAIVTSADTAAQHILNDLRVRKKLKGKELFALWDVRRRNDMSIQHQIEQRCRRMMANKEVIFTFLQEEAAQYRLPDAEPKEIHAQSKGEVSAETATTVVQSTTKEDVPSWKNIDWKDSITKIFQKLQQRTKNEAEPKEEDPPEMTAEERRKYLQERMKMLQKMRREEVLRQIDQEKEAAKHSREMAIMEARQEQERQRKL